MNPINLRAEFIDGTSEECVAIAADLIAFESHFDLSVARLEKEIRLTHLFFLAWHVLKRTGKLRKRLRSGLSRFLSSLRLQQKNKRARGFFHSLGDCGPGR
jgi:hypothetical protein